MLLPLARMNSSAFSFLSDLVLVLLLFIHVPSSSSNDDLFTACSKKFECGGVSAGFPFWGNDRPPACGVPELELRCENNDIAKMNISQVAYRVLEINQDDRILRIAREDSFAGLCPPQFMNSTFNPNVFESDIEDYKNLTIFYGCKDAPPTIPGRIPFTCKINEVNDEGGYIQLEGDTGPGECNRSVLVPVSITDWPPIWNLQALEELLKKGFEVRLKVDREACLECFTSSGACGIDYATNQTTCYCPNQSSGSKTCARGSSWSRRRLHSAIGISAAMAAIITFFIITICLTRRKDSFSAVIAKIFRSKNSQHVPSSVSNSTLFNDCSNKFVCGNISADFPFWGTGRPLACGIPELEIKCEDNIAKMNIDQVAYRVLDINQDDRILRIAREDYLVGLCPPQFVNSTFNPKVFESVAGYTNLTFIYGCVAAPIAMPVPGLFTCKINAVNYQSGYIQGGATGPGDCYGSVFVPVSNAELSPVVIMRDLEQSLKEGFEVRWKVDGEAFRECNSSSGVCGIDSVTNQTTCYCPDQSSGSRTCAPPGSTPNADPAIPAPGISAAVAVIITFSVITICLTRRKGSFSAVIAMIFRPKNSQHVDSVETFMMDNHSLTPKRYSYSDIKKMTSSFINILGQGGFGYVYRGKLPDGRLVAIKVLKEAKGDGEEFMNEVASISRTSHVNVVTLLGFCYERNKRALIYEFMPNGSLDSFIFDKGSPHTNCRLEWKNYMKLQLILLEVWSTCIEGVTLELCILT
ncbi:hypothetical protein NC652_038487 [Populus alba x Populus x berolinensis]|nr:hypothetical protein NC652_038487 [Populus alba x Populus x berolinensis]